MSCLTHPDACNENEQCALSLESGNYTCICPQGFTSFNGNCNRKLYLYEIASISAYVGVYCWDVPCIYLNNVLEKSTIKTAMHFGEVSLTSNSVANCFY